jgi:cell division protein DivIC
MVIMRRRRKNKTGAGIIAFVVLILFAIISYRRMGLAQELKADQLELTRLDGQIQEQEDRKLDIEELKKYTESKQYIEDIARQKLGLVYKDEILFEKEDE